MPGTVPNPRIFPCSRGLRPVHEIIHELDSWVGVGSLYAVLNALQAVLKRVRHPGQEPVAQTGGTGRLTVEASDKPTNSFPGGLRGPNYRIPEAAKSTAETTKLQERSICQLRRECHRDRGARLVTLPPSAQARGSLGPAHVVGQGRKGQGVWGWRGVRHILRFLATAERSRVGSLHLLALYPLRRKQRYLGTRGCGKGACAPLTKSVSPRYR